MSKVQGQRRLREIMSRIEEIGEEAGRMMWELGGLLTEVEAGELWRATPHAGFLEWVDREMKFSRQTCRKYQRINQHFSADMARLYGSEKLDAGLKYLDATKQEEKPGELAAAQIRIRTAEGTYSSVPFTKASVRQITAAAKELSTPSQPKVDPVAAARVEGLRKALGEGGSKVRVAVDSDSSGTARYSFTGVSVGELAALIPLLQRHLLDPVGAATA